MVELAGKEFVDGDTRRLTNRLPKYGEYIFTFLNYADVPLENNFAERQIRPAVILPKNSQSNRSQRGAATQSVLMSVYRTLRLRGLNPTNTIAKALISYLATGQLPPLPGINLHTAQELHPFLRPKHERYVEIYEDGSGAAAPH